MVVPIVALALLPVVGGGYWTYRTYQQYCRRQEEARRVERRRIRRQYYDYLRQKYFG